MPARDPLRTAWRFQQRAPHQADSVGLAVIAAGVVLFFVGRAVAKAGRVRAA